MRPYRPDPTNKLTFEWVVRQFNRLSSILNEEIITTKVSSTDSPYTVRAKDEFIFADAASGAIIVNLAVGEDLRQITIKNTSLTGSNLVTVTPDGSDTVDGLATFPLTPLESIRISYDADDAAWWVL